MHLSPKPLQLAEVICAGYILMPQTQVLRILTVPATVAPYLYGQ